MSSASASASAGSAQQASLNSLSSDLIAKVAGWLTVTQLCLLDTAINNKQLRFDFLDGISCDFCLYPGRESWRDGAMENIYVQWLIKRRVFVNSIFLEGTTPNLLTLYDTINRLNPGLVKLTVCGGVAFPTEVGRCCNMYHNYTAYIHNYTHIHTNDAYICICFYVDGGEKWYSARTGPLSPRRLGQISEYFA
jgi:hypothetical protein